jgi:hypothetical protein
MLPPSEMMDKPEPQEFHLKEDKGTTAADKAKSLQQETKPKEEKKEKKGLTLPIMNIILESDDKRMTPTYRLECTYHCALLASLLTTALIIAYSYL